MPVVEPPPYPRDPAPWGGEPIAFHDLLRIDWKQTVRRWEFRGVDPHHLHHQLLRRVPLPAGDRFSVEATEDRWDRVWLFDTQAEAEAAAEQMRDALVWRGTWVEVSPTVSPG